MSSTDEYIRVRGFPKAGIKHPVTALKKYSKVTVTDDELEVLIAYRKHALPVRKAVYHYLTDKTI